MSSPSSSPPPSPSSLPTSCLSTTEEAWKKVLQEKSNSNINNSNNVCTTVHMRQHLLGLRNSLTCPICNQIYTPPVVTTLACGHSFCEVCINAHNVKSWKCPVEGCGTSIMVTGKSSGYGNHAVNPSLESSVVAVNNIVQALARAKPYWWKQEEDEVDESNTATGGGGGGENNRNNDNEEDDDDDDDDDTTIDLQAAAASAGGQPQNEKTDNNNPSSLLSLPENNDNDDNDDDDNNDDDETVFETAQS